MKHIQNIIDDHIKVYGLKPQIPTRALQILFAQGAYDKCVLEVLRQYNMPLKLRIQRIKLNDNADAKIAIPEPMPVYLSHSFREFRFFIKYDPDLALLSMERFVGAMAHEIGHILLHATYNNYRHSEIATDLIAMVMGFEDIMVKGKIIVTKIDLAQGLIEYNKSGYLSKEEAAFAARYIQQKRKGEESGFFESIKNFFKP